MVASQASPMYSRILSKFPPNFSFCFGYGSGVKKQLTQLSKKPTENMIDLIYCVDNPYRWHAANLAMNPHHYSGVRYLGHKFIAKFQENSGAKVYFNTLVNLDNLLIKYGVISSRDLITDLLDWCDLYLAGRLHKPVEILRQTSSAPMHTAIQLNLESAVHAALLILPETFTEYEFYYTISNLSYSGDFRMTFGENKNKVDNIVKPQLAGFRNLYVPILKSMKEFVDIPLGSSQITDHEITDTKSVQLRNANASQDETQARYFVRCSQDAHPLTKLHHLNKLPKCPQKGLVRYWNKGHSRQDTEDVLRAIAFDPECGQVVEECIKNIVWNSSIKQSLKSAVTAGVVKTFVYSGKKILKMVNI